MNLRIPALVTIPGIAFNGRQICLIAKPGDNDEQLKAEATEVSRILYQEFQSKVGTSNPIIQPTNQLIIPN